MQGGANLDAGQTLGMNFYVKGVDDKVCEASDTNCRVI